MTISDDVLAEPTDSLQLTRRQRDRAAELIGRFLPVGERLEMTTRLVNLRLTADRVREETFGVLVMGEFNRGKSTLINALLGRKVLPTFAGETTATICEVHYGDTSRARLFPFEGAPIETNIDDLERFVAVDENDPSKPNPYRKVEVYWPVPLCRNGVVLVDSPGLNKSQSHEERTVNYLRSADAVVFVVDSQSAWSRSEVEFVRQIPPGIDPFFVFNKINLVDEGERDRLRRSVTRRLAEIMPTGVRRHYFVDAQRALAAAGHDTEVDRSGVGEFVRDLQRFLATERAAVKIGAPARELAEAVREARKQIPVRRGQLAMPLQEAEERVDAQRRPLAELVERRSAIVRRIDEASDDLVRDVRRGMRQFLGDVAARVPEWARSQEVSVKVGVNPFTAEQVAQDFTAELGEKIQERIAQAYLEWRTGRLTVLIDRHTDDLGGDLEQDLAAFEARLDGIRSGLLPDDLRVAGSHRDQDGTPVARAMAAAGGMLLAGPGGAFVGARLGPTQMLKSAIPQIAVGAGILMFTPLGWAGAAIAMAVIGVRKVFGGVQAAEGRLRTSMADEIARNIAGGAADRAEKFGDEIAAELGRFRATIDEGLTVRIEELQNQLAALLENRNRDRADMRRRMAELDAMETELDALDDDIADLLSGLGPAVPAPRHG